MTKVARVTNTSFGIPCYRDTSPYVKMLLKNHGIGNKGGSLDSEKKISNIIEREKEDAYQRKREFNYGKSTNKHPICFPSDR